jgi:hypothetical protein
LTPASPQLSQFVHNQTFEVSIYVGQPDIESKKMKMLEALKTRPGFVMLADIRTVAQIL